MKEAMEHYKLKDSVGVERNSDGEVIHLRSKYDLLGWGASVRFTYMIKQHCECEWTRLIEDISMLFLNGYLLGKGINKSNTKKSMIDNVLLGAKAVFINDFYNGKELISEYEYENKYVDWETLAFLNGYLYGKKEQ